MKYEAEAEGKPLIENGMESELGGGVVELL